MSGREGSGSGDGGEGKIIDEKDEVSSCRLDNVDVNGDTSSSSSKVIDSNSSNNNNDINSSSSNSGKIDLVSSNNPVSGSGCGRVNSMEHQGRVGLRHWQLHNSNDNNDKDDDIDDVSHKDDPHITNERKYLLKKLTKEQNEKEKGEEIENKDKKKQEIAQASVEKKEYAHDVITKKAPGGEIENMEINITNTAPKIILIITTNPITTTTFNTATKMPPLVSTTISTAVDLKERIPPPSSITIYTIHANPTTAAPTTTSNSASGPINITNTTTTTTTNNNISNLMPSRPLAPKRSLINLNNR